MARVLHPARDSPCYRDTRAAEPPSAGSVAPAYATVIIRLHGDEMTMLDDGSWLANPLAAVELGPGTVTSAGAREWTLEFGPLEFVERFSVTDRSWI